MKKMKRTGIYKGSNVEFNPHTMTAVSYDWWHFLRQVGPVLVFNHYSYSMSTNRHQSKVRGALRELGISPDLEIEAPEGLQKSNWVENSIAHYQEKIESVRAAMAKGRKSKIPEREETIRHYAGKIAQLKMLEACAVAS